MLKFLNKPYPFNDNLKHNAKITFFISIGVLGFLLSYQPINIGLLSNKNKIYLVTGIALSTFLSLSLNLLILPSLFPKHFLQKTWNIRKEIFWNLWILFTISVSDFFFYSKLIGIINFDAKTILNILLIAILPVSVLIVINQERLLRSNLKSANKLNQKLRENKIIQEKEVFFESDYKKDSLTVKVSSLLFIRSANNYIEIFWRSGENIKHQLVRCSLIKAEEKLRDYSFIIRCHRAYIVNINHIEKIEGNSQGYKLFFDKVDFPVLVSQKYINIFQQLI